MEPTLEDRRQRFGRAIRRENLDAQVRKALGKSGLSLAGLEPEITEGVLIEDVLRAKKTMQLLKSLGILIALDDFGTGYSSLSYHRGLPLDWIKIYRAFVGSLGQNERSLAIVRAVIGSLRVLACRCLLKGSKRRSKCCSLSRGLR